MSFLERMLGRKESREVVEKETPVEKVRCTNCGAQILPSTAKRHRGLCAPCARGPDVARERALGRVSPQRPPSPARMGTRPAPNQHRPELAKDKCLICGRAISEPKDRCDFSCHKCGLSGNVHELCLTGGRRDFPLGGSIGFVTNVCPRCREEASKPVLGVDEGLIDDIIACLDLMDYADHRYSAPSETLSSVEWGSAQERLSVIGSEIDSKGGLELMQRVYDRVHHKSGRRGSYLDRAWDGIGQWQA